MQNTCFYVDTKTNTEGTCVQKPIVVMDFYTPPSLCNGIGLNTAHHEFRWDEGNIWSLFTTRAADRKSSVFASSFLFTGTLYKTCVFIYMDVVINIQH